MKNRTRLFILLAIPMAVLFLILAYQTILKDYANTKTEFNDQNLARLIYKLEEKITVANKFAINYASDDDLFNYLNHEENDYINKNFREGTRTLEDASISYLIITDKKNELLYSTFTSELSKENNINFKNFIINFFENTHRSTTIIHFNKSYFTLSKKKVYNSAYEGKSNGFIYVGSKINKTDMNEFTKDFVEFEIISKNEKSIKNNDKNNTNISKIILENVEYQGYNNLILFDNKSQVVFKIKTKSDFNVIEKSESTIKFTFTILLSFLILIIILLTYRYKRNQYKQNDLLEEIIGERTNTIQDEIDDLKKTNLKLYDIAHTDFLTKSMTRRNFFIHAENIFSESIKENSSIAVVMIDIDNFKKFNDNYGHDIGDKVLVEFAQCIKNNIKEDTIFGRLGGEEFALLLSDCSLEKAIAISEYIKEKVEQLDIKIDQTITASFGVSDREDCKNIDEMLQKADRLLYKAKEGGRNQVRSRLNT